MNTTYFAQNHITNRHVPFIGRAQAEAYAREFGAGATVYECVETTDAQGRREFKKTVIKP